ncbi:hypothetical protein KCV07_g181, partial [Aureobasidium melanogenum]
LDGRGFTVGITEGAVRVVVEPAEVMLRNRQACCDGALNNVGNGMEPVGTAEVNEPVAALTVDDDGWISMLEGTAVTMAGLRNALIRATVSVDTLVDAVDESLILAVAVSISVVGTVSVVEVGVQAAWNDARTVCGRCRAALDEGLDPVPTGTTELETVEGTSGNRRNGRRGLGGNFGTARSGGNSRLGGSLVLVANREGSRSSRNHDIAARDNDSAADGVDGRRSGNHQRCKERSACKQSHRACCSGSQQNLFFSPLHPMERLPAPWLDEEPEEPQAGSLPETHLLLKVRLVSSSRFDLMLW